MKTLFVPKKKVAYESRVALITADAERFIATNWKIHLENSTILSELVNDSNFRVIYDAAKATITDLPAKFKGA